MIQIISPITVLLLAAFVVASLGVTDANVVHPIITHVLDVSKGRPGNRMRVQLYRQDSSRWIVFQDKFTNFDGRINDLIPRQNFSSGNYCLVKVKIGPIYISYVRDVPVRERTCPEPLAL